MVLERGVAGAQPLHKGGRLRPTAQMKVKRREGTPLLASFRFANQLRLSSSDVSVYQAVVLSVGLMSLQTETTTGQTFREENLDAPCDIPRGHSFWYN